MGSVFVSVGLSLDGYIAPEGMVMHDPGNQGWGAKWGELMAWALNQRYLRERLKLGAGGELVETVRGVGYRLGGEGK